MKTCLKCRQEKALSEFHVDLRRSDGHISKCKDCAREEARLKRLANIDRYHAYEASERGRHAKKRWRDSEHGQAYMKAYRQSEQGRAKVRAITQRWVEKNPEKRAAHRLVEHRRQSDPRLCAQPCTICGNPHADAHHEDYSKPLDVIYLCRKHHMARHRELKEKTA